MKLCMTIALLVLLSAGFSAAKPTELCRNIVNCFVDPCQVSSCPAYPDAQCISNYCGGCNALWYLEGELINDCSSSVEKRSVVAIPKEKCRPVFCKIDPCKYAKCKKYPEAVCRSNYCGGCHAWFYVSGERIQCN